MNEVEHIEMIMNELKIKNITLKYCLTYKNVKNINLRIKPDGTVHVSANRSVSQKIIEDFILSKSDFILKALEKFAIKSEKTRKQYFSEVEIRNVVLKLCKKVYPYFAKRGIKYPVIKFRKMVSQWGNCRSREGVLTFNTNLMYAPIECIEYVVLHEFTHFLQANHSEKFYAELGKICPEWKRYKATLKEINIR